MRIMKRFRLSTTVSLNRVSLSAIVFKAKLLSLGMPLEAVLNRQKSVTIVTLCAGTVRLIKIQGIEVITGHNL